MVNHRVKGPEGNSGSTVVVRVEAASVSVVEGSTIHSNWLTAAVEMCPESHGVAGLDTSARLAASLHPMSNSVAAPTTLPTTTIRPSVVTAMSAGSCTVPDVMGRPTTEWNPISGAVSLWTNVRTGARLLSELTAIPKTAICPVDKMGRIRSGIEGWSRKRPVKLGVPAKSAGSTIQRTANGRSTSYDEGPSCKTTAAM